MNTLCTFYNALKWANEGNLCFKSRKIRLDANPDPFPEPMSPRIGIKHDSKIFKKYIRQINSCLSLAPQAINEIHASDGAWNPHVVIQEECIIRSVH